MLNLSSWTNGEYFATNYQTKTSLAQTLMLVAGYVVHELNWFPMPRQQEASGLDDLFFSC